MRLSASLMRKVDVFILCTVQWDNRLLAAAAGLEKELFMLPARALMIETVQRQCFP